MIKHNSYGTPVQQCMQMCNRLALITCRLEKNLLREISKYHWSDELLDEVLVSVLASWTRISSEKAKYARMYIASCRLNTGE